MLDTSPLVCDHQWDEYRPRSVLRGTPHANLTETPRVWKAIRRRGSPDLSARNEQMGVEQHASLVLVIAIWATLLLAVCGDKLPDAGKDGVDIVIDWAEKRLGAALRRLCAPTVFSSQIRTLHS